MGGLFSSNEEVLREKRVDARRQLYHLDRLITKQKEQLDKIEMSAATNRADAELLVVAKEGLQKLESLRLVVHTRLNEIETDLVVNSDNEIYEELRKISESIRKAAMPIPVIEPSKIDEAQETALQMRIDRMRSTLPPPVPPADPEPRVEDALRA